MKNNIPEKRIFKRKRRFISVLNNAVFNKSNSHEWIPF
jgi:hypothetical protein